MPRCPKRAIFDMGWGECMSPVITRTLLGDCWDSLLPTSRILYPARQHTA